MEGAFLHLIKITQKKKRKVLHCLRRDVCVCGRTVEEARQEILSKEFGSGNTAACRMFCSCY